MTDKEFCKIDTEFYGEVVDNIKQIKLRSFDGEELKEYVEHCIKLNLLTIPVVSKCYTEKDMDNVYDKGFNDGNQRDLTGSLIEVL